MSLVPAVTELILAELLYLQYDNPSRPVYMYINSAGVTVSCSLINPCYTACEVQQPVPAFRSGCQLELLPYRSES